jgi:hypothetical protein
MKRHKPTILYKEESRLFYVALFSCVAVFVTYMYFVSASVMNVVMRKETDAQIRGLATHVGQLEAEYIDMQHSVSSDIASLRGFVVADDKIFIDRSGDTLVLLQN